MNRLFVTAFAVFALSLNGAVAQDKPPVRSQVAPVVAISPIFGQLMMFSQPVGFKVSYENRKADSYIREAVLAGETIESWTQMITVTGHKGLAANAAVTPQGFANTMAGGFKKSCPDTYSGYALGSANIDGAESFMVLVSCGTLKVDGKAHSETALITIIKGANDYYSLQWAERGAAVASASTFDGARWKPRADALQPIRLCAIVPGEKAPYPSCVEKK